MTDPTPPSDLRLGCFGTTDCAGDSEGGQFVGVADAVAVDDPVVRDVEYEEGFEFVADIARECWLAVAVHCLDSYLRSPLRVSEDRHENRAHPRGAGDDQIRQRGHLAAAVGGPGDIRCEQRQQAFHVSGGRGGDEAFGDRDGSGNHGPT